MTNELTVRVEHPELPAIRWNGDRECDENLTEMLAACTRPRLHPGHHQGCKADRAAVNKLDKQLSDAARSAKALHESRWKSSCRVPSKCRVSVKADLRCH